MNTPANRIPVSARSYMIALVTSLVLAACAPYHRPPVWDGREILDARPVTVRFDNEGTDAVDVYLVGDRREWRLGRVVAGGVARLVIPEDAIVESVGFVRLAAIEGGPPSARAALDPRTRYGIAQPIADLPRQRFVFWERAAGGRQLVSLR